MEATPRTCKREKQSEKGATVKEELQTSESDDGIE